MILDSFLNYCLAKKGVEESFPFNESTLVLKVGGKMFASTDVTEFRSINLKCIPEKVVELRERYMAVQPGYHMNKKHWNTVETNSDIDDKLLFELINHSYDLVFESLPKSVRNEVEVG